MASWLVCLPLYQPLRVRAQAADIVLCSWARHLTLTVPLSTQVYKWVLVNLMLWGNLRWSSIPSREGGVVEIPLVSSCCRNQKKAHPLWRTWLICGLKFYTLHQLSLPWQEPCWTAKVGNHELNNGLPPGFSLGNF